MEGSAQMIWIGMMWVSERTNSDRAGTVKVLSQGHGLKEGPVVEEGHP